MSLFTQLGVSNPGSQLISKIHSRTIVLLVFWVWDDERKQKSNVSFFFLSSLSWYMKTAHQGFPVAPFASRSASALTGIAPGSKQRSKNKKEIAETICIHYINFIGLSPSRVILVGINLLLSNLASVILTRVLESSK